ncbi:hypothetical protein Q8A73_023282 [Channa argus]|nr:hypothetical protein Q8A73_023282 [Channa argus]
MALNKEMEESNAKEGGLLEPRKSPRYSRNPSQRHSPLQCSLGTPVIPRCFMTPYQGSLPRLLERQAFKDSVQIVMASGEKSLKSKEGGSSWAQREPAALTLRAGTSRQQPAGSPPSSSRTGKHAVITPFIVQLERREAVSSVREAAAVECRSLHLSSQRGTQLECVNVGNKS